VISGKRLIAVGDPLAAYALDRQDDGQWTQKQIDLSACMNPQSVSPGAEYFSATWRAHACTFEASNGNPANEGTADRATDDIIWSPAGGASAELLVPQDLVSDLLVGRHLSGKLASRIKGAHIDHAENEKSRLISVSESGTRVALIDDDDEHKLVRVYSLASHRPLLTRFERNAFDVAPDGDWIALGTPESRKTASIDVIPLKQAFDSRQLLSVRVRIPVNAVPTRLFAVRNSVVVRLPSEPETTAVFDATTGKLRFEPRAGRGLPLGASGEVLLFEPSGGEPWRLVKTMDGTPIAAPDQFPVTRESFILVVSPKRQALAVVRRADQRVDAALYSIRGETVTLSGHIRGLPEGFLSASMMRVAEDGSAITDLHKNQMWPATKALDSAQPTPIEVTATSASPMGRFVLQKDSRRVIRQADHAVLKQFTTDVSGHSFSSDDRWLAVWGKDGLQVFDLARGETAFGLNFDAVDVVEFGGHDSMLKVHFADDTMLVVPLDLATIEQFGRWLAPRDLTPEESSMFGLERENGRKDRSPH
jgi:hypothetical protein